MVERNPRGDQHRAPADRAPADRERVHRAPADRERARYREILVVDLLGGFGDLLMLLPAVHGLARAHPGAALRVLTHEPGADLLRGDPAVRQVRVPRHDAPGAERAAVVEALAARPPDLAVTTTRYDGIPDLLAELAGRSVTDLWRRPPPDEPVGRRYLRILHQEGLLAADALDRPPRVPLRPAELATGEATVAARVPARSARPPVVLVPDAGMAVKRWPDRHWWTLADTLTRYAYPLLTVAPAPSAPPAPPTPSAPPVPELPAPTLPALGLRDLAGCFRAVADRGGVVVGGDTGPVRLAAAVGAATVGLFGPTTVERYGFGAGADLSGLPDCPYRQPTAITEQLCWWTAQCPLSSLEPACMADLSPGQVIAAITALTAGGRVDAAVRYGEPPAPRPTTADSY